MRGGQKWDVNDELVERYLKDGEPWQKSAWHASEIALRFAGLARWWLKPQLLKRASQCPDIPSLSDPESPPPLPTEIGCCWPLLVIPPDSSDGTPLRAAFPMPLQWKQGSDHDRGLPRELRDKADMVVDWVQRFEMYAANESELKAWKLHRARPVSGPLPHLSGLTRFDWSSATLPLTGGLIGAIETVYPNPEVWATGTLMPDGRVDPVEGLGAKVEAALTHGAKRIYVSNRQSPTSRDIDQWVIRLYAHVPSTRHRKRFEWMLNDMGIPPRVDAPREMRRSHYLHLADAEKARNYFLKNCLEDVTQDAKSLLRERGESSAAMVVTIASDSSELIDQAVHTWEPQACLILCPDRYADRARQAEVRCRRRCRVIIAPIETNGEDPETLTNNIAATVQQHCEAFRDRPGGVAIDLTPGQKVMSLALVKASIETGATMFYWHHEISERNRRVVPFSQQLWIIPSALSNSPPV